MHSTRRVHACCASATHPLLRCKYFQSQRGPLHVAECRLAAWRIDCWSGPLITLGISLALNSKRRVLASAVPALFEWSAVAMSGDEMDEDLARALALSMQEVMSLFRNHQQRVQRPLSSQMQSQLGCAFSNIVKSG